MKRIITAGAWAAQVQAPLQQVEQQISSDESTNPASLTVDGAQLSGDAQAVLNDETDPAPVGNSDFLTAMNDYIAAGNDYSGDNSSGSRMLPRPTRRSRRACRREVFRGGEPGIQCHHSAGNWRRRSCG